MWYQILQYLNFLWHTAFQKQVDHPLKAILKNAKSNTNQQALQDYRTALVNNHNTIEVTDFGAGSRVFKSNTREISKIAKNAGITKSRAKFLYKLTQHLKPKHILELGTSLGLGTSAMAMAQTDANIITIEGCPETAKIAQQQFTDFNLKHIDLRVNTIENELDKLKEQKFDLIYIDGNHQKDATLHYFKELLPTINEQTIIIFDDIHWSQPMSDAWQKIKNHPQVTTTIDTFFWGIVSFNSSIDKHNFSIRL